MDCWRWLTRDQPTNSHPKSTVLPSYSIGKRVFLQLRWRSAPEFRHQQCCTLNRRKQAGSFLCLWFSAFWYRDWVLPWWICKQLVHVNVRVRLEHGAWWLNRLHQVACSRHRTMPSISCLVLDWNNTLLCLINNVIFLFQVFCKQCAGSTTPIPTYVQQEALCDSVVYCSIPTLTECQIAAAEVGCVQLSKQCCCCVTTWL